MFDMDQSTGQITTTTGQITESDKFYKDFFRYFDIEEDFSRDPGG